MSRGDDFDFSELYDFTDQLIGLAERKFPAEVKRFMRAEGNKLRKLILVRAKSDVKKNSGNYIRGIKRGKVYRYEGDQTAIRVYNSAPHAHLIEKGHRQVAKDGTEVGFVKGKLVFEKSKKEFESTFYADCEEFVEELLDKGMR
ncbi:MAG: HK97 gp10 family phage protein [Paenibacillus sp.]|uniref:HK97 gp10 family phage protein n=1 Tax=Paenibacillus sp. TaxID=58172 RepID=UPI0029127135|nr:HK97 gp10 family phage protein [Paenibacillus sp.]MDU4696395.1 HK97 gp10 family phage protein [Paenibacillus sp.]